MPVRKPESIKYARCRFTTQLPVAYLYSSTHFWSRRDSEKLWQVGLTKFGTRLLGEIVEQGFTVAFDAPLLSGQVIGWIEGFKCVTDMPSFGRGRFRGPNPSLEHDITILNRDPYGEGWLYAFSGEPAKQCMPVRKYIKYLNQTIDRLRKDSGP